MVTRGKCLIFIKSMISTVKLFKLIHQFQSSCNEFFGNALNPFFARLVFRTKVCFSHLQKNFCLLFFNNKIWEKKFAKMGQAISSAFPTMDRTFTIFRSLFWGIFTFPPSKIIVKPISKTFISRGYGHNCLKEARSSDFIFIPIISNEKGPFSINNACQICDLSYCIIYSCIFTFCHFIFHIKCDIYSTRLRIKCTAAETNPDGIRKNEVIVRASWKHEEASRNDLLAA